MKTFMNQPSGMPFLAVAFAIFFLVPANLRAQQTPAAPQAATAAAPAPASEQQPVAVIKKESKLVLVDAVVTDKKGEYVRNLTQKDFKVYEDNKEQQVATFSTGSDVAIH